MSRFGRFLGKLFGGIKPAATPAPVPRPSAKYDAAQTGTENQNHWANADYLSANAANTFAVRITLRIRSRYEVANNGYAAGLIRQRTNDTIGTGPRLQLDFPDEVYDADFQRTIPTGTPDAQPADLAREVEKLWCAWCEENNFADLLRVMADAEDVDGEAIAYFMVRDTMFPVKLGLRVIECDRLTTPGLVFETPTQIDGILYNTAGDPITYSILRQHPGNLAVLGAGGSIWDYDDYPASQVIHLYDQKRPEQGRGIPILTPALPLYAILRRYTLATLGAAELGAMIAGVIENPNMPPDASGDDPPEITAMDAVPFARNSLLTLANGQTAKAFDSKNPNANYAQFKSEVLTEAGRACGEMRNTATGSSAEYNYSSGRLDHLPRQRGITIRRERLERKCLDRVFRMWLEEAALIPGYLPDGLPPVEEWDWCWQWDGFPSIDPKKDAEAVQILKTNGLLTDAQALAEQGIDWREHYKQLAREKQMRADMGIEPAAPPPPLAPDMVPADTTDGEVPTDG